MCSYIAFVCHYQTIASHETVFTLCECVSVGDGTVKLWRLCFGAYFHAALGNDALLTLDTPQRETYSFQNLSL